MNRVVRVCFGALLAGSTWLTAPFVQAQPYPNKSIKIIGVEYA